MQHYYGRYVGVCKARRRGGSSRRQLRINGTGSYIYILVINVQCLNEIVKKEKIKHEKM